MRAIQTPVRAILLLQSVTLEIPNIIMKTKNILLELNKYFLRMKIFSHRYKGYCGSDGVCCFGKFLSFLLNLKTFW